MDNLEGLIQILSAIIPTNDNPRAWVTWAHYIKGSDQIFDSVSSLVSFHPNRMKIGMEARIINYPVPGNISVFNLVTDPDTMVDANGDSIVTNDNFLDYWNQDETIGTTTGFDRVYEYAPDSDAGGAPPFPYESDPSFELKWTPIYDATKNHKWIRFRDDDVDDNADDIFDHWTAPIAINQSYASGDYIDIRFKRQVVSTAVHTTVGTMTNGKYYIVTQGYVIDITLNQTYYQGKVFLYNSANTYSFSSTPQGQLEETVQPIPRTDVNGNPNNEPTGWSDTVPAGTDQLWKAVGQKSVYGNLKSAWIITKVKEDPNYIRYSSSATPYPGTIVGVDDDAGTGSQGDTDFENEGWSSVYSNQTFIATRQDDQNPSSPKYTQWLVQKIAEESGEYIDRVFKLYPIGLDNDSPLITAPTKRDPTDEGWYDTPQEETSNEINYFSEARKFFDGTLKSAWSKPFPFTGQDVFADAIISDLGDEFKYDQFGSVTPAEIELTAILYKGVSKLWEDASVNLSYSWKKVYDNGSAVDISPTSNSGDDFYFKPASGGAPGAGEFLSGQRVGIKPGGVTGKAVFQCTQTFDPGGSAPVITFVSTYSIVDISDGIDAKTIVIRSDTKILVWDSAAAGFVPETFVISAFQSNLPTGNTFYWYKYDGANWNEFTVADNNHTFPDGIHGGRIAIDLLTGTDVAVSDIVFTVPGTGAQAQITSAGNELPAMLANDEFQISGHSDPENNGVYKVITVNTSTSDYEVDKIGSAPDSPVAASAQAVTVTTSLNKLITTDQHKQELRYAVTNTQANPETADYATKFSDFITILKLGSTSTGEPGTSSVGMILSNEAHTLTLDSTTGDPISGQIGATGTAISTVELYNGQTHLDYGVDYTSGNISVVTKSTDTGNLGDVTFNWVVLGNNFKVYVDTWTGSSGVRSAVAQVSITYGGNTYSKDFTVTSTVDAPGAIILDIDSDKGFSFTPSERGDKTIIGLIYDNNNLDVSDNYTYRWLLDGVQVKTKTLYSSGGHQYLLQSSQVQGGSYLTCEIYTYPADVLFRSRTVFINDITDAKAYLLYFTYNASADPEANEPLTAPPTPVSSSISTFGTDYPSVGNETNAGTPTQAGWGRNPGTLMYWVSQGVEQPDKTLIFGTPYRVRSERGYQGTSGIFMVEQYHSDIDYIAPTLPAATGGSGGGIGTNGWTTTIPSSDIIWGTRRFFEADGVTPVVGSSWSNAYLITGKDGGDGNDGDPGADGPGYDSISDLGITAAGDRRIRFNGVNGATDKTIDVRDGPPGEDLAFIYPSILVSTGSSAETSNYINNVGRTRPYIVVLEVDAYSTSASDGYVQINLRRSTNNGTSWTTVRTGKSKHTNNDTGSHITVVYMGTVSNGSQIKFDLTYTNVNASFTNAILRVIYL